jgi:hypothetical protein
MKRTKLLFRHGTGSGSSSKGLLLHDDWIEEKNE